jgi:hypothetical protein
VEKANTLISVKAVPVVMDQHFQQSPHQVEAAEAVDTLMEEVVDPAEELEILALHVEELEINLL